LIYLNHMKKWSFILILLPLTCFSQLGFETRYFTINSESLPRVEDLSNFTFNKTPFVKRSLNEFQMNANNYRKTVDMALVVNKENNYVSGNVNIASIQSEFYRFGTPTNYLSDGTTRVKNTVYKEMKGLDLLSSCPPYGICARCASYRVGRGY